MPCARQNASTRARSRSAAATRRTRSPSAASAWTWLPAISPVPMMATRYGVLTLPSFSHDGQVALAHQAQHIAPRPVPNLLVEDLDLDGAAVARGVDSLA